MIVARVLAKSIFALTDLVLPRVGGLRILIYHQVGSGRSHEMNVSLNAFRRQVDWLQAHGEIVGLEEGIARRGEPDSNRLFVLTFDDGYADVFENAYPLMKQRKIPFTLYLTSGPIENPQDFPEWPGEPLSWDQIRTMQVSGLVTVGAHTHTHPDLRHVMHEALIDELDRSNHLISQRVGVFPAHFTYPKGKWAPLAHEAVRARYRTATIGGGKKITEQTDLHKLHRVPAQRSDLPMLFRQKMRSGGRTEDRIRRLVHGYEES